MLRCSNGALLRGEHGTSAKICPTNCQAQDISNYRFILWRAIVERLWGKASLVQWPSQDGRYKIASLMAKNRKSQAPFLGGMSGLQFGSPRGVTALRRRACAHRCQLWRQRRRIVLDHRPQRRRQDLDRQLHLGPLPADRRPIVLSRPGYHRTQSERPTPARHRPHLPEPGAVSSYERARQYHGRAASFAEKQFHHGIAVLADRRAVRS